jgi:PEP-CTERM motif
MKALSDKSSGNSFSWIAMAAVLMLAASGQSAVAQVYNFTFLGGSMTATGTIDIVGGVATSGSINVTGVPLEADPTMFTTASGALLTLGGDVRNHDGDVITYDTVANAGNDPVFDSAGIAFGSDFFGYDGGTPEYNTIINIWGNSPGSYSMFVGEAQLDGNGNVIGDAQWVYTTANGSLTLTTPTPEPSTVALIMLGALTGFAIIRRRRATA